MIAEYLDAYNRGEISAAEMEAVLAYTISQTRKASQSEEAQEADETTTDDPAA